MTNVEATLTLGDIAALAGVQRPVVSAWRTRPTVRGRSIPFPAPVDEAEPLRFRRDEIVEWLRETGRGNNPDVDLDAPAWSAPDNASLEDLATLLCLRSASTGEELAELEHEDLIDVAEEVDPDDQYLLSEVRTMAVPKTHARFVDDLAEASRGPAEALDRLERSRTARQNSTRELTDTAVDLVRAVAMACARNLGPAEVPLVHTGGSHRLSLALGLEFTELVVPDTEHPGDRALLRRTRIRGIETTIAEPAGPSVHLRSVLGSDGGSIFGEIEYVMDGLGKDSVALILGPAALLCDEVRGDAEKERAQLLRTGQVVFAARLPRGLWKEAHRQALGLWVCAGHAEAPLRVTDIDTLDDLVPDDVASDVVAALNDDTARSFRYARLRELSAVLAKQAVVPQGTRAVRVVTTEPVEHRDRVIAATQRTSEPAPGFDVRVLPAASHIAVAWSSLGQLKAQKLLTIKRGRRYDQGEHDPDGTVHVVDGTGPTGLRLDPIEAAQRHLHAARTEPSDVVHQSKPRPAAWVDPVGGALLGAPARIIRLSAGAGLGPHTLAAIINRLPEGAGDPLSWSVPQFAHSARELDETLAAATAHETLLRDRLDALRDLTGRLIDAVADGALTIEAGRED